MASLACYLWWILLGGLLGWLGSWLLGKMHEGPAPAPIEKLVDRPVDRIVEKIVEKPVDRIVEKMIDNPAHLSRITTLETAVASIAGLQATISTLRATPPTIVEKIVEKPVDRIVEKIVEKPVDRVVEKIVEKPVDRVVEKLVEKMIDNPVHLTRIASLEAQVATIVGLQATISTLRATPPTIVEKIVEKPVDRIVEKIVEKPVDRIVEKIVEKPVDRVVEKLVPDTTGLAERDQQIALLRASLETAETGARGATKTIGERDEEIARLRRGPAIDIGAAKAAGFTVRGDDDLEIIEGIGPKIAELLRNKGIRTFRQLADTEPSSIRSMLDEAGPTFRISDPGTWPEQSELASRNRWTALAELQQILDKGVRRSSPRSDADALRAQLAERDAELERLRRDPELDLVAAKAAGFAVKGADDLKVVEGIGPKIEQLLHADGVKTFAQLSRTSPAAIRTILEKAGPSFALAKPETWPEQAALAANNQWRALKALQDVLTAGNR
jgi:predicted flap endonuclease-1-like 5' DNA nuclease